MENRRRGSHPSGRSTDFNQTLSAQQVKEAMQQSELAKQLDSDAAREVPPFGAESIETARQQGAAATDILLEHVNARGATAFLALEALREANPNAYHSLPARERAEIYVNALRTNTFFNAWGLPGYQLTETARALVALGDEAVAALKPLLADKREAPLSGSQDATTSDAYGNRICDYAWVLLSEIKHLPYTYFKDSNQRDAAMKDLNQA
jgi:hypothetical protein